MLAGLDGLLVGGASADLDLLERARAAGVTVVRTYGMTETCGGCVYDGLPLDGVRMRIDDGQVLLAGPMLFDGYIDDPWDGEWFATADRGEIDGDGRLRIIGRIDEVIVSGGVNIPLPAVERALRSVEGVGDVAVVGVDDHEWGSRVVAAIVPADALCLDALRLDLVRDSVSEGGLPRAWAPRQLVLVDELPLLPGGKVDRSRIRELAGQPADATASSTGVDPPTTFH
jgi:O-succinylbenzoic acid--CoA ligase